MGIFVNFTKDLVKQWAKIGRGGKKASAFKVHLNWDFNKLNYSLFVINITSQYSMKDISRDCGDNFSEVVGLEFSRQTSTKGTPPPFIMYLHAIAFIRDPKKLTQSKNW